VHAYIEVLSTGSSRKLTLMQSEHYKGIKNRLNTKIPEILYENKSKTTK
jgi:hypothetical protein